MPSALLVDDDPVGRRYLADALAALGVDATACEDATAALRVASERAFDVAVIDLRLPDASGHECLTRLRATQPDVPAIALTAELDGDVAAAARAAGFDAVAAKPLTVDALARLVQPLLPGVLLEDAEGERAAGSAESLAILRGLLARELPGQLAALEAAFGRGDRDAAREILHRMRGSASFCGAARLASAAQALSAALAVDQGSALRRLRRVARETLQALGA